MIGRYCAACVWRCLCQAALDQLDAICINFCVAAVSLTCHINPNSAHRNLTALQAAAAAYALQLLDMLPTSTPHRRVTKAFLRNATVPSLLRVAPSSTLDCTSSDTARPSCRRGMRRQLLPSSHSAASTGRVKPPKIGRGSGKDFLHTHTEAQVDSHMHAGCWLPRSGCRMPVLLNLQA